MVWKGKVICAVAGFLITRNVWGAVVGMAIGHLFDQSTASRRRAPPPPSVSEVFFRSTFEMMGYIAKSDGRVSEAEIEAARRVMQQLKLTPADTARAIDFFRAGKSGFFRAEASIERLRLACGQRHDLLRNFVELQLRAAVTAGISPPARVILTRLAEKLGISGVEFARMEAYMRAQRQSGQAGSSHVSGLYPSLAACYAELEVEADVSDQELTKAYRRQMSRHHPDKLVANGLPESMAEMAKEKTQRIQEAYEGIRAVRGMQ
ncbi:MAG: co-chaperone DjlA [Steroidobacteraceae bacterium]|jgi:DnaJ like chaperone protein